jgi:23S rRNA (uracil1939-C5)-methyltransferase
MRGEEDVRIERAVYGGAGVARTNAGSVVLVPFVLPGEFVAIELDAGGKEAKLMRVIEPAQTRVEPRCPHFGSCGGCHYQHAAYPAQLAMKQSILVETMQRAGVTELPVIEIHAGEPWQYRNRVRFRIGSVDGALRLGYSIRGTNDFLPITECPITTPLLWSAASALLKLAAENDETRLWLAAASEIEMFANDDLSRLQMTLICSRATPAKKDNFARLCEALHARVPDLAGAGVMIAEGRAAKARAADSWGSKGLAYRVGGESYWVSRGGFFQVNRFLVAELVKLVCAGRRGDVAWDLFAGVGLFSRVLAQGFTQVTAVEASPAAAKDLQPALAKLGPQHRAIQTPVLGFLRGAVVQRERPELIVLDPPRAGAGVEACDLLLRLGAREMVYVSCDPTTLARDLARLQQGYRIEAMHLVDLFPQTFHLETVVVLKRKG